MHYPNQTSRLEVEDVKQFSDINGNDSANTNVKILRKISLETYAKIWSNEFECYKIRY